MVLQELVEENAAIPWHSLRSITDREVISALIRDGFELRSQRGSHQRCRHSDGRRVTVTFHRPGKPLAHTCSKLNGRWKI